MSVDELIAAASETLAQWYGEEEYHEAGYEQVSERESGGKHDLTDCWVVLKHVFTGRYAEVWFSRSYNDGLQDYSFGAREVYPHVITTTVYKDEPQAS